MTREEAIGLLETHIQADNLRKHCLATEAIMRELARRFGEDSDLWGIVGLLHDLDFEYTRDTPDMHGRKSVELLAGYKIPQEALHAVMRHNAEMLGLDRETLLDYALTCAETMTGMIIAAALVHPDKQISSVNAKSVRKRMKSKDFARNVNREHVMLCERIDVPLMDFIELSLKAMSSIGNQLGL